MCSNGATAGSSRWSRPPRRRPTAFGCPTARCSASSRPPRRRSAPTVTAAGSPPTVSGTSASTRCAVSTCAARCAAARRTRSSRRWSRAAGARAPIAERRSGWRWPAAHRSSRSAASSAIRISRCTREAAEVSAGAGHPGGEPFKADVRERGAGEQVADRRLFMQLHVFGGCTDPKPLVSVLEGSRLAAVLYQDVNDPRGVGVLAMSEDPSAYGDADLAHDVRLACHGLDVHDNDFVIGLIGRELHPLSHLVQTMRKTAQTSQYLQTLGPFFVGHVRWQSAAPR